jgi:hypothetical protein
MARYGSVCPVSVPDPDSQDPYVFEPPGSFPFLIKVLSGLK